MRLSLTSLALAALAAACSSVPAPHHGIESARAVLVAVRSQPNLTDDARLELARAEQALTAAEAAHRRGKKKERAMVEHLAYIAHQRALLAKERAELMRAEDALDVARNESRALINARNRMPPSARSGAQAETPPAGAAAVTPGRVAESVPVPPPGNPDIVRAPLDPPRQIGGPAADAPAAVTLAPAPPLAAASAPIPPNAQDTAPVPVPPGAQASAPSPVPPARATAPAPVPPSAQATVPPTAGRDARPIRDAAPGVADRSPADRTVAPPRAPAPAPPVAIASAPPVPVGNARAAPERARRAADSAAAKAPEKASSKSGKGEPRKAELRKTEPRKTEPARSAGAPRKPGPERTAAAPRPDGKTGATDRAVDKATADAPPAKPAPANDGTVVAKAPPRSEPESAKAPPRPAPEAADARAATAAAVPGAKQTPRGAVIMLGDDQFNLYQAYLRAGATRALDPLAEFLRQHPERRIRIEGFTDNTASESENQRLSLERANEVRKALIRRGVASDRMQTVGHGAAAPIASNETPAGREQNRRVEIVVSDERGNPARR